MTTSLEELNIPHASSQLEFFRNVSRSTPENAVIVEIGTYVGAIACQFAIGERRVFSIDPWSEDVYEKDDVQYTLVTDALQNRGGMQGLYETWMKNAGDRLFKTMFPIKGYSHDIVKYWTQPIDLLYIDGCHKYESVKRDILEWSPFVKTGGIIMGDDYGGQFEGVAKAVHELVPNFSVYEGNQWCARKTG